MRRKRRSKTFSEQNHFYECEDFKYFLIDRWILGIDIYPYYMELNCQCRFEFIEWLLCWTPHSDWSKIIRYLLKPRKSNSK